MMINNNELNINLHTWFTNRDLSSKRLSNKPPEHFVKSSTPLTSDSFAWVNEKLVGRFYTSSDIDIFSGTPSLIYFEDPKELMIYELTWG